MTNGIFSKYTDILFEVKATADEVYNKYYSDIDRKVFNAAIASDPTAKNGGIGKYTKWILNLARHGKWKPGDSYETKSSLERFAKIGGKLEKKDIQQYSSVGELYQAIRDASGTKTRSETKNDAEKVYEDEDWTVIHPLTKEAAILYGKNTKWCTAAIGNGYFDNMFDRYNDDGPLYIIISKKYPNKKWQFHVESDSFMNAEDQRIQSLSVLSLYGDTDGLFNFITTIDKKLQFFPNRRLERAKNELTQGKDIKELFDGVKNGGEGLLIVKMNKKYNYYNPQTKQFIGELWFDNASEFHGGFGCVIYKDSDEEEIYSPEDNDFFYNAEGNLSSDDNLYDVDDDQVVNYINHDGYLLFSDQENVYPGHIISGYNFDEEINGYARVEMDWDVYNGTENYLSKEGKLMLPPIYRSVRATSDGLIIAEKREERGSSDNLNNCTLIDITGRNIFGNPEDEENWFNEINLIGPGIYAVGKQIMNWDGGEGFKQYRAIYSNGKPLNNLWFSGINKYEEGFCLVQYEDKVNFMDTKGNLLLGGPENIANWVDSARNFKNGIAVIVLPNTTKITFIDTKGRRLTNNVFSGIGSDFINGYCLVKCEDGLYYIIDDKNFEPITPGFARVEGPRMNPVAFKNNIIIVNMNKDTTDYKDKLGFYNFIKRQFITDCIFEFVTDFKEVFQDPVNGGDKKVLMSEGSFDTVEHGYQQFWIDLNGNIYNKSDRQLYKKGLTTQEQNYNEKKIAEGIFSKYFNII